MNRSRALMAFVALAWAVAPVWAQHAPPPTINPGIPTGFNAGVDYQSNNFAYSPNTRKFVDTLPGLGPAGCTLGTATAVPTPYSDGTCGQNNLGQYIPIADKSGNTLYPDADYYDIGIREYTLKMHSDLPPTTLRGYYQVAGTSPGQSSAAAVGGVNQYLGPVIVAKSFDPTQPVGDSLNANGNLNGAPVRLLVENHLPVSSGGGQLFLPVDPTLQGAGPGPVATQNFSQNRAVVHLHGGATPWISDGTPHQWTTPAGEFSATAVGTLGAFLPSYQKGASFQNVPDMIGTGKLIPAPAPGDALATHYYSNQQSQRFMFYHDHAYGITRLNVYAGLAAGYVLHDQVGDDMIAGTNVSGAFVTAGLPGLPGPVLPNNGGGAYTWGIPLVIQDKSFVNDPSSAVNAAKLPAGYTATSFTTATDPLWLLHVPNTCLAAGSGGNLPPTFSSCGGGNLWFPHEYMPNEDPFNFDPATYGTVPWGRWDYGPWMNPPTVPLNAMLPSPSHVPETFADTMLVNGTAYPAFLVQPTAYRFSILSAGNDRVLNLQLYVAADKNFPTTPGTSGTVLCDGVTTAITPPATAAALPLPTDCTEVKMVAASNPPVTPFCATGAAVNPATGLPTGCTPSTWPVDGRNGGVPDPATAGPPFIQIGNEGGILPQVVTIAAQPIDYEYSRRVPTVLNVKSQGLLLMPAVRADVVVDFCAFAGKTLILYNDAPAPMPLWDERNDLYTGMPDWTAIGGAPSIPPGYGPNTRTVMQFTVAPSAGGAACTAFNTAALAAALPQAYKATQPPPIVPQAAYNTAFGTTHPDTFVANIDATVNLTGAPQGVAAVKATLPGAGYLKPPIVSFVPVDGKGSGAAATACLNGVGGITVTVAGAGYTTAPAITFTNPAGVTLSAKGVATLNGGGVSAITVTEPGCNYATNPTVTVAAPACTINTTTCIQATATANVTLNAVGSIQVSSAGSGYNRAPFVFLTPAVGDPGKGATADAMLVGDTVIGMKNITEGFEPWYARMNVQLGTTPVPLDTTTPAPQVPGIASYFDPPSDFFNDGQVQVFRIAHLGVDSHIVHFHLMNLQVINRVDFTNTMYPPEPNEVGWKESIRTNPFTDLVVAAQPKAMWLPFSIPRSSRLMDVTTPAGSTLNYIQPAPVAGLPNAAGISNVVTDYGWEYVWHCHLLGHEENDMMRPIVFNVAPPSPPTALSAAFTAATGAVALNWTAPATGGRVQSYQIQRSTTATFTAATTTTFTVSGSPPATTYTDTVPGAVTYRYRVASVGVAGVSTFSNTVTVNVPPVLTSITPNSAMRGTASVTIAGTYLTGPGGATRVNVSGGGVTVSGITATATQVTATFTIGVTAATGARNVTVTVPGAPTSNTLTFTVVGPTLTSILPAAGVRGGTPVVVNLSGSGLLTATAVTAGTGVTASTPTVNSDTSLTTTLTIAANAGTGGHNVTVTTTALGASNAVTFTVQGATLAWSGPTPALNSPADLTPKTGTITLRNSASATSTSAAPLTLTAPPTITYSGRPAGTGSGLNGTFSITGGTCVAGPFPLTVNSGGGFCTITVQYVPTTTSAASARVTITDIGAATPSQSPAFNGQ